MQINIVTSVRSQKKDYNIIETVRKLQLVSTNSLKIAIIDGDPSLFKQENSDLFSDLFIDAANIHILLPTNSAIVSTGIVFDHVFVNEANYMDPEAMENIVYNCNTMNADLHLYTTPRTGAIPRWLLLMLAGANLQSYDRLYLKDLFHILGWYHLKELTDIQLIVLPSEQEGAVEETNFVIEGLFPLTPVPFKFTPYAGIVPFDPYVLIPYGAP